MTTSDYVSSQSRITSKFTENTKFQEIKINKLTRQSLILLQRSIAKIHELTQARNAAKLSSSRVVSIGKELKELTKVLSQYCENEPDIHNLSPLFPRLSTDAPHCYQQTALPLTGFMAGTRPATGTLPGPMFTIIEHILSGSFR